MKKEPLTLYIMRILFALGMFAFMGMLYWSSLLLEERMVAMQGKLDETHLTLQTVEEKIESIPLCIPQPSEKQETAHLDNPNIDKNLPNLLEEDPFYQETLPKMLGKDFTSHGTFRYAVLRKPENLHPFSNWSEVIQFRSLCSAALASLHVGNYDKVAPQLAKKMEARPIDAFGNPEFWVHLRDDIYWQPLTPTMFEEEIQLSDWFFKRHPVTAHDFKFFYDALMNPHNQESGAVATRTYLEDIEDLRVIDDKTFVVRWKTHPFIQDDGKEVSRIKFLAEKRTAGLNPLASFVYQYFEDGTKIIDTDDYKTNSVFAENFSNHWAKNIIPSCGAWIFQKMTDKSIRFRRNPDFLNPLQALAKNIVFEFKNSPDLMWQSFKSNQLETHTLGPRQIIDLESFLASDFYQKQVDEGNAIEDLRYLDRAYYYIGWNLNNPLFKEKKVRQALTMAIDRERIIEQYLNGLGIQTTGTFSYESTSYDHSIAPWPYDPGEARRQLEAAGFYDRSGSGTLDTIENGEVIPFQFTLSYFVKDPMRKAIAEYIATALKQVGVDCRLKGVDLADLTAEFEDKSFEAILGGWGLGTPPEDPKQLWDSEMADIQGSSNIVSFSNPEADRIIEKLQFERDPEERIKLYHQFDQIIHIEQPYTFLFIPKSIFLYREYVGNVFIPKERQDLIPGANMTEPISSIFYLKK